MFTNHLIWYTANTADGPVQGVARVGTDHASPSWSECAEDIPGFACGEDLGIEPQYTLTYDTPTGPRAKRLGSGGVEHVGSVLMRCADRDEVWDIKVSDDTGHDVTFNFAVFRQTT